MEAIEKRARELLAARHRDDQRRAKAIRIAHKSVSRDDSRAVRAVTTALSPQWQPIGSAPKDGTACLGFSPGVGCPILIRWIAPQDFMTTSECERYMDGCADSEVAEAEEWLETPQWWAADFNAGDMLAEDCQPTHWMPLPAAPAASP